MLARIQHQDPDLVVYGGSFDPPHLGHQYCIDRSLRLFPRSNILVVPASAPVSNSEALKPASASFKDRLEMCRLAFEQCQDPRLAVSSVESEIEAPNFTLKTLKHLRMQYPGKQLCFLMGEDQWENFSKWKDPQEVLKLCSFLVIRRKLNSSPLKEKIIAACKALGLDGIDHEQDNMVLVPLVNSFIYYQDIKPVELASSKIRTSLRKNGDMCADEISKEVRSYICSLGLYQ